MAWQPQGWQPPGWQPPGWDLGEGVVVPAGGTITLELPSGSITMVLVRPGEETVTTLVVEGRDLAVDRLAGSAFAFIPKFLNADGDEYQPTTVHVKVVLKETGEEIIALTEVAGWTTGSAIPAPGAWTELEDATVDREEHIIRIIGDNGSDASRNELRMIIGCLNPER